MIRILRVGGKVESSLGKGAKDQDQDHLLLGKEHPVERHDPVHLLLDRVSSQMVDSLGRLHVKDVFVTLYGLPAGHQLAEIEVDDTYRAGGTQLDTQGHQD